MAATLREKNTFAHQDSNIIYSVARVAQTFTPVERYLLTSYKFYYNKVTDHALITALTLTDGSGNPTTELALTSIGTSGLPLEYAWAELVLATPVIVEAGTEYCIWLRTNRGGPSSPATVSRTAIGNDSYAAGTGKSSVNSGSTWTNISADFNFEVWGEDVPLVDYRIPVLQDFQWQPPVTGIQNNPPA